MRIDILTLFPGMFGNFLGESIMKRAREKGKADIALHNIRDYSADKRRKADDRPFGGGPGMVLQIEPIYNALKRIAGQGSRVKGQGSRVVLMSPQGEKLTQRTARRLAKLKRLIVICGHYEGVDERVKKLLVDCEISIGDYVLTCGELPAMVLVDAVVRLIPGVLGDGESTASESFEGDLLEYPQYTRPASFCGMRVPDILLSGDHKRIAAWRMKEAVKRTKKRRPDLLNRALQKRRPCEDSPRQ